VVVTDLAMPGMSGFDLVRRCCKYGSDIPIVMTSGYLRPEDQLTAAEFGIACAHLEARNTIAELEQCSTVFLPASRARKLWITSCTLIQSEASF
jgi:CheY-like chemotaxis protein